MGWLKKIGKGISKAVKKAGQALPAIGAAASFIPGVGTAVGAVIGIGSGLLSEAGKAGDLVNQLSGSVQFPGGSVDVNLPGGTEQPVAPKDRNVMLAIVGAMVAVILFWRTNPGWKIVASGKRGKRRYKKSMTVTSKRKPRVRVARKKSQAEIHAERMKNLKKAQAARRKQLRNGTAPKKYKKRKHRK